MKLVRFSRGRLLGRSGVLRAVLPLVGAALLTTCSDNPTGPGRPGLATLRITPTFDNYARLAPLTLDNVRITVIRPPADTVARATSSFSLSANQVQLAVQVPLLASSEDLEVLLELYSGAVPLFSGQQTVHVTSGGTTAPQSVPVAYIGPGTQAVSIAIAPRDSTLSFGAVVPYRASALDGNGQPVAQFYVSWSIPSPPSGAAVDAGGVLTAPGARDTLLLVATTPKGLADTTSVIVAAPPSTLTKVGGDGQSGGPGSRLPLPLEVLVQGTDGLPVPGIQVAFGAPAGASVDSATATTNGQGVARTGAVLGAAPGQQAFTASAAGLAPVRFTETAVAIGTITWTGATSTDWSVAGNWNPAQVPNNTNDVIVPSGTPNSPGLTASGSARSLTVQAGAVLSLNGINFQAGGNVFADGSIAGPGAVQIAVAAQVRGNLPDLIASGPVALAGVAQIQNLTLSNGDFALSGHSAVVNGNLATQGSGTITMTNAADALTVVGSANFAGGSTAGKLTAGLLILEGPAFTQSGATSSFAASGTHRTNIARGGAATLTFADPVNSGFHDLNITGMTAGVTLQSDVRVGGQLIAGAGTGAALVNTGATVHTLTVAGVAVNGLQVDKAPLVIQGGTISQFDNVQFTTSTTTGSQLTISNPGAATPFAFNNLSFATTPGAGAFYLDATDTNPADGLGLVINMVNPTPSSGGAFVRTAGGAIVNWPFVATAVTWTGAVSTDWNTAGNWTPASVPGTGTTVTIAPATNQPLIATAVVVAGLTVQSGATLTVDGAVGGTLTLGGTLTVNGTLTGPSAQVNAVGNITAPAGSQIQLLSLVVGAGLNVQGSYAVGTTGFTGSGQTIPLLPYTDLLVIGTAQLAPGTNYTPTGNVSVTGQLTLNGSSLVIPGAFQTSGTGKLVMTQVSDLLRVLGATSFAGGSTAGLITAGQTDLRGDFFQGGDPQAFAPSGGHLTILNVTAPHGLAFTNPSPTQSHFQGLNLSGATGAITLGSDVEVTGTLISTPSAGSPSVGAGAQLFAIRTIGVNVTSLTLNDATLAVDGGPITSLKGVTFQNTPTAATALTLRHPGPGSPFALSGLTFAVTPTTGFYLRADDSNTGDGVPLTLNVTGSSPAVGAPFIQAVNGAVVNWPPTSTTSWTGALSSDWFNAGNWSAGQVPDPGSLVTLPAGTPHAPGLTAAASIASLTINAGQTLEFTGHTLQVAGDVLDDGGVSDTIGGASITITGTGQVRGTLRELHAQAPVTAAGNVTVVGSLFVDGAGTSNFNLNGHHLDVTGSLLTTNSGTLTMTNPLDTVLVTNSVSFAGGSTAGRLTAGAIRVLGSFTQLTNAAAFVASGSHTVQFIGQSIGPVPAVSFTDPATSHFQNLDVSAVDTMTLSTNVAAVGQLISFSPGTSPTLVGTGVLTAGGADITGLVLDGIRLSLTGGTIGSFQDLVFKNQSTSATQLTVANVGTAAPIRFDGLQFLTTPVTGLYLAATDLDGPSPNPLVIDVTNASPASGAPFFTASNGAVVNWPPSTTTTWTGGAGTTDWFTPANWSTNLVPGTTDSVIIQASTTSPVLTAGVTVGAVDIQSGTLTLNGNSFTATRTFLTAGTGRLVMTNAADHLTAGRALFAGADETGFLTDGVLEVLGDFAQTSAASVTSFRPTGNHTTLLNGSSQQNVSFQDPASGFQHLTVTTPGPIVLQSAVQVVGVLTSASTAVKISGGGNTLTAGGLNVTGLTLDDVPLTYTQATRTTVATFNNVVFQNYGTTATQFTVNHPGLAAGPLTFDNLTFTTVPTTGFYLSANDAAPTDGTTLVVNVTNSSPASGAPFIQTSGGAVVNWPPGGGAFTWTGAVDTDWFKAGNWSGGQVPAAADSAVIPLTANSPVLIGTVTVKAVEIQGGSVTLGGNALIASSSFTTSGTGTVVMTSPADAIATGKATFGGGDESGLLTDGGITMTGDFSQLGTTSAKSFAASGNYTVLFNNPTVSQKISFQNSASGESRFAYLALAAPAGVTLASNVRVLADVLVQGASGCELDPSGHTLTIGGGLSTNQLGSLRMAVPTDSVLIGGNAAFLGGSSTQLTDGVLKIGGNFAQVALNSTTSFAASGNHLTVLGSPAAVTADFGSPGPGLTGSHFANLDLSPADGGVSLTVNSIVEGALITHIGTPVPKLVGSGGMTLTANRLAVEQLLVDGAALVLNEQGVAQAEKFDNVTFINNSNFSNPVLAVTGPGGAAAVRNITFNNVNFDPMTSGFYVVLTVDNLPGTFLTLTMSGSNQGKLAGGNGPVLSDPPGEQQIGGAQILWP